MSNVIKANFQDKRIFIGDGSTYDRRIMREGRQSMEAYKNDVIARAEQGDQEAIDFITELNELHDAVGHDDMKWAYNLPKGDKNG